MFAAGILFLLVGSSPLPPVANSNVSSIYTWSIVAPTTSRLSVPAILLGVFVWWSLRAIGKGSQEASREFGVHLRDTLEVVRNTVVLLLVSAAILRGTGLDIVFAWSPLYLEETLSKRHLNAGFHYYLLTGMGIISAPILGVLSDRFGRKPVLVPGFFQWRQDSLS